jgi:hypothetical protein
MEIGSELFNFAKYFGQYGYNKNLNFVAFYGNKGQDMFGNFWKLGKYITYGGIKADNIETLYHAAKFPGTIRKKFNKLSALQSFYLSRKHKYDVRPDWNEIKDSIMLDLLRIKFRIPLLTVVLLSTGDKYLVEHNPVKGRDEYWSDNNDGTGQNKLGELLMKIRSEFFGTGIVPKSNDYLRWIMH